MAKKIINYISVIFCLSLILVGNKCAIENKNKYDILHLENETSAGNKVTLRFISPWAGSDVKATTLKQVLEIFLQENQDIEIIDESMSGSDYLLKLKTDFVSGNEPDVFGIWAGANMTNLIKAGKVADLTMALNENSEWKNSIDKSVWYYVTNEDKIYGVPLELVYQCLFINKDMFTQYNVKVPETFSELKQAVIEFRKHNVIPIAFTTKDTECTLYQNTIASLSGRINLEQSVSDNSGKDYYSRAYDYIKQLYELKAFPDNMFNLDIRSNEELFLGKQAAMIVQNSDFIGEVNKWWTTTAVNSINGNGKVEMAVDIIPFPAIEEGIADPTALIYGLGSGTFSISQVSWDDKLKREAGIKLIKFLTSERSAYMFVEQTRMLSCVRVSNSTAYYSGLMRRGNELIDNSKEFIAPPGSLLDRTIWESLVSRLPYILEGNQNFQQAWDEIVAG